LLLISHRVLLFELFLGADRRDPLFSHSLDNNFMVRDIIVGLGLLVTFFLFRFVKEDFALEFV